jgi:murein DD-endopeptidase MepM/ murein hydrolase activator NlpD
MLALPQLSFLWVTGIFEYFYMEEMNFAEILRTLKQLFDNFGSRREKRTSRTLSVDFKGFQAPLKGSLHNSGGFDSTGKGAVGRVHQGVDLRAPGGTEVYPIAPGKVTKVYGDPKGGNAVVIQHSNGFRSYYAHMGTVSVHSGDTVGYGTVIGTCGASGNAKSFPHVHFQVWRDGALIDPASIISMPAYTPFNPKKEKLWLPGAKALADNWNIKEHLNSKTNRRIV